MKSSIGDSTEEKRNDRWGWGSWGLEFLHSPTPVKQKTSLLIQYVLIPPKHVTKKEAKCRAHQSETHVPRIRILRTSAFSSIHPCESALSVKTPSQEHPRIYTRLDFRLEAAKRVSSLRMLWHVHMRSRCLAIQVPKQSPQKACPTVLLGWERLAF